METVSFEESISTIYLSSLLCAVLVLLILQFRSALAIVKELVRKPFLKHMAYRSILNTTSSIGQWSRADVLAETAYIGANVFCVCFRCTSLNMACRRAANLCLANFIFLCATPHLDALTNTLGLRWSTTRRFHGSIGILTTTLLILHAMTPITSQQRFILEKKENKWAITAAASLIFSVIVCLPPIKRRMYEWFLRMHQSLSIVAMYGIWVHVAPLPLLPRAQIYMSVGCHGLSLLILGLLIAYRNALFRDKLPRATIETKKGAVLVDVTLSRPVHVEPGQYISLWLFMPSTSFASLFQYHPFTVASWSDGPQETLRLLIEPRAGFTQHLLRRRQTRHDPCRALFSGPHGTSVPVGDYAVVLMVATGYGIAAQMPYLKKLLHEYNSRKAKSRRIHLIWELKDLDLAAANQKLLNEALKGDTLDHGYILQISIYAAKVELGYSKSHRAEVIQGLPDWYTIIDDEAAGKYIRRVQEEESMRGDMIITGKSTSLSALNRKANSIVSASPVVRQEIKRIARNYVYDRVDLVELNYQPSETASSVANHKAQSYQS